MSNRSAAAIGLSTVDVESGRALDAWYPQPALGPDASRPEGLEDGARADVLRGVNVEVVETRIDLDAPPADTPDAYLRLHLLSHRLVRPHEANLDGVFGVLPNVAWTSLGPMAVERVDSVRLAAKRDGVHLEVYGVDKFPRMTDYV